MFTELYGQVERITFSSEENGYTIAKLKAKGHADLVTIAGNMSAVNAGEILKLKGQWFNHPKYGEQFKIESYETIKPATAVGIEKYLGSGLIKGIGPVMAKRIVKSFGIDTLTIIEETPSRLQEVEGIGAKRIDMIIKAWEEQREIKEVMLFLQSNGVSANYASKIFRQYGKESINIVRDNPYRLAHDIFGIGFITADRIAENMGIAKDSVIRAEAGIIYTLHQMADEGHTYYPYELLINESRAILATEKEGIKTEVDKEVILKAFANMEAEKNIVIEDINEEEIIENNKAIFLSKYYASERGIARSMKRLFTGSKNLRQFDIDKALDWVQKELKIPLAENQTKAVREAISNKMMVITGGPGTGKTTIIKAIIKIYSQLRQRILLGSPTGRAAKRITEATGMEAKTIHRLLEFSPKDGGFKHNEDNPLQADLIVIDESSMIDTILMHHFLKAVPTDATLILVGDIDQLPSVGAGNVLKDIISSEAVTTVTLNEIFRQSKESLIITNAHKVNKGDMPYLQYGDKPQDFYFFEIQEPEDILAKVINLCKEGIPRKFGYSPVKDIQVLTAMHRGTIGAGNLNKELQKALNPSTDELIRGGKAFRKGDKVMQITNNYDKDIYNGDIGIITKIDRTEQELSVDYYGRIVAYDYTELDEIVLAYAISIHKSQGSEYPVVVMPIHTQHYMLLQRNLLYTGMTRGKRLVVLTGTKKAIAMAVKNNKPQKRYTYLSNRLQAS